MGFMHAWVDFLFEDVCAFIVELLLCYLLLLGLGVRFGDFQGVYFRGFSWGWFSVIFSVLRPICSG